MSQEMLHLLGTLARLELEGLSRIECVVGCQYRVLMLREFEYGLRGAIGACFS